MRNPIAATLLATLLLADSAAACTTFCARGLFGRNYDFEIGYGMLVVNKRGIEKRSSLAQSPAAWTSRYGSLTFNQFGRDEPTGGVNEKGLVVELMWLDGTRYPAADARPQLGTLEWIQYQLDNAATVDEVVANMEKVRISERGVPLHYLIADKSGATAAIEFLDGKLLVHRDARALANDTYASSTEHYKAFKRDDLPATSSGSLDRFARASNKIRGLTSVDQAFALLDDVAQHRGTQWSIVYDLRTMRVHYRTTANRERRSVDLASLDFRCATPVQILDIDDSSMRFTDYTYAANVALVKKSMTGTSFLRGTPVSEMEESARHPDSSRCAARPL